MEKSIVILGAGIGGIVAARELRRHFGAHHRITLVDKSAVHTFPPSYLWVMLGWRKPAAIQKQLLLLEKYGINFHHASVEGIETVRQHVVTDCGVLEYDYLIIALGAELTPRMIPGLAESAHSFYTVSESETLGKLIPTIESGTIAIVIAGIPYTCPPAPYEASLLLRSYFARKKQDNIRICLFTPEPAPFVAMSGEISRQVSHVLGRHEIEVYPHHLLTSVEQNQQRLTFGNGSTFVYDYLIAVPPHCPPRVLRGTGLSDSTGWIPVDRHNLRTRHANIFAIGDSTVIPLANGFALPKAGVFAVAEAEIVAHNLAREITGTGIEKSFAGTGYCFLETGNGRAGYINGNFFATPEPIMAFHEPNVTYHWGKVVFEKYWLWRWF